MKSNLLKPITTRLRVLRVARHRRRLYDAELIAWAASLVGHTKS